MFFPGSLLALPWIVTCSDATVDVTDFTDLSSNHLQGTLPLSLRNCKNLQVLDLGYNLITDTFPCWLSNLSNLHVFVIRSNSFYGNISCPGFNGNWINLQIIDIASNGVSGFLPPKLFASFQAVMDKEAEVNYLHYVHPGNSAIYYQDSATVVIKGASREVVKILNIFTSIDLSNNSFQGSIPVTIGDLKLLKLLNLSHNALTGPIPQSIGKLESLESLGISVNKLSRRIPTEIASLSFLSSLNLSYNQLTERIPRGSQFQTFTELTFKGNQGLCGIPLSKTCGNDTSEIPTKPSPETNDDADYGTDLFISIGLGFFVGFVIIVGPLAFLKRWRTWYNNQVDRFLPRIFKTKREQTRLIFTCNQEESTF
ncbi:receptor-like protein 12 [Tanacetum coccineum]|uniref:Receptor-like protein 12 n=1 Tax=Tanacetum coccineum TaxID=301880 RepID=A0ABQ4XKV0_9ASTR